MATLGVSRVSNLSGLLGAGSKFVEITISTTPPAKSGARPRPQEIPEDVKEALLEWLNS